MWDGQFEFVNNQGYPRPAMTDIEKRNLTRLAGMY